MYGKRDRVRRVWRAPVVGTVGATIAFLALISRVVSQTAQDKSELMMYYVPPSALAADDLPKAKADLLTKPLHSAEAVVAAQPTSRSSADRWRKFDDEFAVNEKSAFVCLQPIQSAKYGLDTLTFGTEEAVKQLEFTRDVGGSPPPVHLSGAAGPGRSIPLFGEFGQAQFKSVVTTHDPQTGEALAGLKLVIPFGPGGPRSDRYTERNWGADGSRETVMPERPTYLSPRL
jgi:hypothetical protein